MLLELTLLAVLAQTPPPPLVCVEFRGLQETHGTVGVFTVQKLKGTPKDPSMWFLWPNKKLYVFTGGKWIKVEQDYAYSRKPCSDPPWYVPVSQRLREQRWVEKVQKELKRPGGQ